MIRKLLRPCKAEDRLTSLPDELLDRILSMLPTKDATATVILCKRMRECLGWISSIDLDDSPIIHCSKAPYLVERFPVFESFVDNILQKFSPPYNNSQLTRFRLHFGGDEDTDHRYHNSYCQPHVLPAHLNAWISYPLGHYGGLRELDLSFHVSMPDDCELPSSLFACRSLQVLRLASRDLAVNDAKIPLICFPNLKLLHLGSLFFNDDDFVTRLVSSCPVLQYLSIKLCSWWIGDRLSISSPSLQSLVFIVGKDSYDECKSTELVVLNTPNLQYFEYHDIVAAHYSIAHMNALVKASISVYDHYDHYEAEVSLIRAMSHVQDLSINRSLLQNLYHAGELRDQLPVFPNLRSLQLDALFVGRWDVVLLSILHCTPSLETLVFLQGLFSCIETFYARGVPRNVEETALEAEGWRIAAEVIPSCCLTHLKRIVFESCFGSDRELNTIKFLLTNSLVLEELVICLTIVSTRDEFDPPSLDLFENALKDLPRASNSCRITLQRKEQLLWGYIPRQDG